MGDSSEEDELLSHVPTDGRAVGNTSLMRELGWDEDVYWDVRNRLIDRGILAVGRGKGGSVRRPAAQEAEAEEAPAQAAELPQAPQAARAPSEPPPASYAYEVELYAPMAKVIEERWVKDKRFESAIVQITAQQGRKKTGGKWTRPDITVATLAAYPYVPGRHFDVVSFEVKTSDAVDVAAVYEALAHLRSATKAYVLFHVPEDRAEEVEEDLTEVRAEAKKHGVGVIVAAKVDDYATWEEFVEPVRREPDPRRLNDFLAMQFTQEQLERLIKWFK